MTKVILKRWDGGVGQSERPETINEQTDAGGFDIFKDSFKITKTTSPTVNETASGASVVSGECPIFDAVKRDTDGLIIGCGATSVSGSGLFRFYRKDSSITGAWTQCSDTTSSLGVVTTNRGGGAYTTLFKNNFYGFTSNVSSSAARLYLRNSDSSHTLVGTISDYSQNYFTVKPIVHSQDKIMYMAAGKTIAKFDGASSTTTFTASAFTTPYEITSICEYGSYLAVGMQTPEGGIIGLWGRDTSITTFQDIIKVDSGGLWVLENLDGYLTAITETPYDPYALSISVVYSTTKYINIRMYLGGTMKLMKTAPIGFNEGGATQQLSNRKLLWNNRLYFSTNSHFLWSFGQNKNGEYVLSRDIQSVYTGRTMVGIYSFFALGEYLFILQRTTTGSPSDGLLQRTDSSFGIDPSYFVTTINPSMPLEDRIKQKKLTRIYVKAYSQAGGNGTVTIKYAFDGASYTTAISETSISNGYKIYEADAQNDGSEFGEGRDLLLKFECTRQIDFIEVGYEYEIIETLVS